MMSFFRHSPAAALLEESTMIPTMTRQVPSMFWRGPTSPKIKTAKMEEKNGDVQKYARWKNGARLGKRSIRPLGAVSVNEPPRDTFRVLSPLRLCRNTV